MESKDFSNNLCFSLEAARNKIFLFLSSNNPLPRPRRGTPKPPRNVIYLPPLILYLQPSPLIGPTKDSVSTHSCHSALPRLASQMPRYLQLSSISITLDQPSLKGQEVPMLIVSTPLETSVLPLSSSLLFFLTVLGAGCSPSLGIAFQYLLAC